MQLLKREHASVSPPEETVSCIRLFAMGHPNEWHQRQKMLASFRFEAYVIRKKS